MAANWKHFSYFHSALPPVEIGKPAAKRNSCKNKSAGEIATAALGWFHKQSVL
jgi:hypothetical protein